MTFKYSVLTKDEQKEIKKAVDDSHPRNEVIATLEREHLEVSERIRQNKSVNIDADKTRLQEIESFLKKVAEQDFS